MSKYFVFCEINADEQPQTMAKWGVSGLPTVKFIGKDGKQLHELVGGRPLATFLAEMEKVRTAAGL